MPRYNFYKVEPVDDLRHLMERSAHKYCNHIAYREFGHDRTIEVVSYKMLYKRMNFLGTALIDMGLQGKHFGIVADNSSLWVLSYLSVINGAGVVVPLDKELTTPQFIELIQKGDIEVLFLGERFYDELDAIRRECPKLSTVILLDPLVERDYEDVYLLYELIRKGARLLAEGDRRYLDVEIDREAMAEILFTSGTTGANKGVMLSHKNITSCILASTGVIQPKKETFSVLPFSHSYELSCHILTGLYQGATITINDSLKHVAENMLEFKPYFLTVVPMFLEAFYRSVQKEAKRTHLDKHLSYGITFSNLIRKVGIDQRRYFFKPVLEKFGGNLEMLIVGGAPVAPHIFDFFSSIGIEIANGYGITECSPLVCAWNIEWKGKNAYSVGKAVTGCEVRIDNPDQDGVGEIQVKGDNVMLGYYKDEKATEASFSDDGWFRTGDLGYMDKKGFVYINGRLKDLIILSNGKNVYPEQIEDHIRHTLGYVKECLVYATADKAGRQSAIQAACYLDPEWAALHSPEEAQEIMKKDLNEVNKTLPPYMQLTKLEVQAEEFIKTSTHKIKRYKYKTGGN